MSAGAGAANRAAVHHDIRGLEAGESVPHYLPEKNPFVDEMTKTYGVPRDAVIGMPETLYPEYRKKLAPPPR